MVDDENRDLITDNRRDNMYQDIFDGAVNEQIKSKNYNSAFLTRGAILIFTAILLQGDQCTTAYSQIYQSSGHGSQDREGIESENENKRQVSKVSETVYFRKVRSVSFSDRSLTEVPDRRTSLTAYTTDKYLDTELRTWNTLKNPSKLLD